MTKVCTGCKEEKKLCEFHKGNDKDGRQYRCTECKATINLEKGPEYRERAKEKRAIRRKQERKDNPLQTMVYAAKSRARKLGVPFNITPEDLALPSHCPIWGIPLVIGGGVISDGSPSLDKFIPELGYVRGNVAIISNKANRTKNNATTEEIRKLLKWMEQQEENKDDSRSTTTSSTGVGGTSSSVRNEIKCKDVFDTDGPPL
jgi:hypothetical protein